MRLGRLVAFGVSAALCSATASAEPRVVVSIKPLHSLAAAVMEGVGAPVLLLPGGQSPHAAALPPSAVRAVAQADVVVWLGPAFEAALARVLRTAGARTVALLDAAELDILAARAGPLWRPAAVADAIERRPQGSARDPHFWLDPVRASRAAAIVARLLAAQDPEHAARYAANLRRLAARLAALDAHLAARLEPIRAVPYIVFHDAFQYLEARYGLGSVGALVREPDQPPGARRVADVRAAMREGGVRCAFAEPQSPSRLLQAAAADAGARTALLDPLGADVRAGPDAYFEILERLADALTVCLGAAR